MIRRWRRICRRKAVPLALAAALAASVPAVIVQAESGAKDGKGNWQESVDYWQPRWMQRELWGPGRIPKGLQARMLRHRTYVDHGVPKSYQGARSNVNDSATTLQAGAVLYAKHCARCHGPRGLGRGDAAQSLLPSPALLAYMIRRPIAVDEYLLWAITDGGQKFGSAMPAFKDVLQRDDIWRIIAYMRAGFSDKAKR